MQCCRTNMIKHFKAQFKKRPVHQMDLIPPKNHDYSQHQRYLTLQLPLHSDNIYRPLAKFHLSVVHELPDPVCSPAEGRITIVARQAGLGFQFNE